MEKAPESRGTHGLSSPVPAVSTIIPAMIWWSYQFLFAIGFVLMLPYFLGRMRRRGGYRAHFGDRFARYAPETRARLEQGGRVWIHAVSVGEIYVGLAFARELRRRRPELNFVFTVNTPTARDIAEKQVDARDVLLYFQLDFPGIVRRALNTIRPSVLILVEGEWWPNLLRQAAARGVSLALINGRMSDRSFRGYRRIRPWMSRLLPLMRVMYVQSAEVRERLIALGAPADRVLALGSAKYEVADRDPSMESAAQDALRKLGWGAETRVLLGGSTWAGEEEVMIEAFRDLRAEIPSLRLLLAPRHAERRSQVRARLEASGIPFALRSETKSAALPPGAAPAILLLDTTGELRHFYASAEVIFIGKSLLEQGGQNPIEPAMCARAVVVGPHMENFRQVMADFRAADAIRQVRDAMELRQTLGELLRNPSDAQKMGERAAQLVKSQAGALSRTADGLAPWFG